ncbi:caspase family protein [Bradyrhizobium sp. NP1]|uniref:caspase family protein n=1 Tax=Bradyrhizobium sp. NP1 TaxID=3049772 RepID=UPI0025A63545|nr:caspase family protein [Bradyrhizobium sp. NP1]WJR81905.1 caspase family protein [Bradyrhizobium sp. NP1]
MRRPFIRNALFASGLLLSLPILNLPAEATESRVALVIGQSAYRAVPALPNAANDARQMTDLLGAAGFSVTSAPDLGQNEMRQAVSDFAGKIAASGPDTVALVFYAGHGLQIDGENYLVPVDVDPKRESDIPVQAVRLNDLMNTLGALPTRMRIVMLDACRNNPFPALSGATGHGLAIVDTKAGASGSFISYSTSPGAEAEDGSGEDSPYTTAVLSIARQPNLSIEEAFKRIRVAVNQATEGRQTPWESSSLTSDFRFFSGDGAPPAAATTPAAASQPASATRTVEDWRKALAGKEPKVAYELVVADDTVAAYEAYVAQFAQGAYAPRVRSLLERRREMIAWAKAVAINTTASYAEFLALYGGSDLAATARKIEERVRNRALVAAIAPTTVALGPTCPCSTPPASPAISPARKKADISPPVKDTRKRADTSTPKRRPPPDEIVVDRGPPPGAIMEGIGLGVGIGLGMGGGGMGRGGGGMPNGGYRRY